MPFKIIIVGAGEVGYHIAHRLSDEGQDVVLIDKEGEKIARIHEELDVQGLLGSGTSPGLLKTAGIGKADMLVAATDSDEVNLISCLLASNLNAHLFKVARVRNPEYMKEAELLFKEILGIDRVINPELEMAKTILNPYRSAGRCRGHPFRAGQG